MRGPRLSTSLALRLMTAWAVAASLLAGAFSVGSDPARSIRPRANRPFGGLGLGRDRPAAPAILPHRLPRSPGPGRGRVVPHPAG